jgi:transposase InsO family protein
LVAPLACSKRGGAGKLVVCVGSLEPSAPLAASARARVRGGDLGLSAQDRLRAAPGRRRYRLLPFDCLEGAQAGGISRPPRPPREPANRYEWPCPGDLLHMDTCEYARFQRPGHRVTGDRSGQDRQHQDGVDLVHAIIDDHTRLAYAEIHADAKAATARNLSFSGVLERTRFLIRDRDSKFSAGFDEVFRSEAIEVIQTPIRAPQANAYAERFVRTVRAECLDWLLIVGRRHLERMLRTYIAHYNAERPHRALALMPPEAGNTAARRVDAKVERHDLLGGLIHEYRAAA